MKNEMGHLDVFLMLCGTCNPQDKFSCNYLTCLGVVYQVKIFPSFLHLVGIKVSY